MARPLPAPQDLGPDPEPVRVPAHPPGAAPVLVVGYDGSPAARVALEWAVRHGRLGGRVIVVYATEPVPPQLQRRWQQVLLADDRRAAGELFAHLDDRATLHGSRWQVEVVAGDSPADALVAAAVRHGAEAIVVGSHGHGPLSGLVGSVSHALLRKSPVAVVVLGPRASAELDVA